MTQTVIGVFNSYDRANAAMAALASKGLANEAHMHVSANDSSTGYEGSTTESGTVAASAYHDDRADQADLAHETQHTGMVASIEHFFSNLFGNDERPDEAAHYQEAVRRGSALLAVDVTDDAQIRSIEAELERAGAVDIDARVAHWQTQGYTGYDREAEPFSADLAAQERDTFPVVEEDLAVGKREVETGRLRVYSRPTERNVSESVNLHEEHADIQRRAVNREATPADLAPRSVEIRETDEVPVVAKTARVVEEVVVGKQGSDRVETINETLHGTTVDVEDGRRAFDIAEHSEIISADGQHVGTVDHLEGSDRIKLTKKDPEAGGQHHYIPLSWVSDVRDGKVMLSKNKMDAESAWQAVE